MTGSTDGKIIPPAKAKLDVPKGVKVERVPSSAINSGNTAGGEVPATKYQSK